MFIYRNKKGVNIKRYNELNEIDKDDIVTFYYLNKDVSIKEISKILDMSQRSIPRVLQERGVNTRLKNRYVIENENYFENIDSEFKAYILGFIYADGFVGKHDDFCISLTDKVEDNLKILLTFQKELGINDNLVYHSVDKNVNGKYTFKFSNKKIVSDLNKCSVYTCKSLDMKNLPQNITKELIRHFFRGYFDGDGTICSWFDAYDKRQRYCLEILGTKDFLNKFQNILCEQCHIKETKLHDVSRIKGLTRISHRGIRSLIKIREYFYNNATVFLTYKHDIFFNIQPL